MICTGTYNTARCSYLCNTVHYVKCGSLVDASPCSSVKACSYERKYRANVRGVDNSGALYLRSYFHGRSENYGSHMHVVSIFMEIQKLWQFVGVSIACAQILEDFFVSTAHA
jgi:hypothetical protein